MRIVRAFFAASAESIKARNPSRSKGKKRDKHLKMRHFGVHAPFFGARTPKEQTSHRGDFAGPECRHARARIYGFEMRGDILSSSSEYAASRPKKPQIPRPSPRLRRGCFWPSNAFRICWLVVIDPRYHPRLFALNFGAWTPAAAHSARVFFGPAPSPRSLCRHRTVLDRVSSDRASAGRKGARLPKICCRRGSLFVTLKSQTVALQAQDLQP
jgi:hypothetical protein